MGGFVPSSEKLYFYNKKSLKILNQNPYICICSRIVEAYGRDILFAQIDIMKVTHYEILILRILVLVSIFERRGDTDKLTTMART